MEKLFFYFKQNLIFTSILFIAVTSHSYQSASLFEQDSSVLKAVIFLSSSCPCSNSHVEHLNNLDKQYTDFKIFGVITDEFKKNNLPELKDYYSTKLFQFPLIRDDEQLMVKKYSALKTPHVVLLQKQKSGTYKKVYEGGVTNTRVFEDSGVKYLAKALLALQNNNPVPHKHGLSLGCYIRRF